MSKNSLNCLISYSYLKNSIMNREIAESENNTCEKAIQNSINREDKEETSNFSKEISKMLDFNNSNKTSHFSLLNKKRRKFDVIHDHLLMLGLFNHGKR